MTLRNMIFAILVCFSTPALAQISLAEVKTQAHDKVEAALPASHPAWLYSYAARLFQEGRKDEAVFWFYAGQLRFRYLLAANPGLPLDGEPALMASLNASIGQSINEWAGGDSEAWADAMDRALEWDLAHPNPITPKEAHAEALEEVRSGLAALRDLVIATADEIVEDRKAAGLLVRKPASAQRRRSTQ